MSSSESEDDTFTTKPFQTLLECLYDDLTESAISAKAIYKQAKQSTDLFTHQFKLKKSARAMLGMKYASMEELLDLWLPRWKSEGRLSANGYLVRVGKEEAELLGLRKDSEHDVYSFANHLTRLFEDA